MATSKKALWKVFEQARKSYADDVIGVVNSTIGKGASIKAVSAKTGYSIQSVVGFANNNFKTHYETKTKRYVNEDDSADVMEITSRDMYIDEEKPGRSYRW